MPKVWLVRHGESVSNADLPTADPVLSELTPRGHEEAKFIAEAFTAVPDLIVVSPYVRARETAVPTRTRFPHVPVEEWPVHEFTYLHPERYNGTTGSQRGPFAHAYWERNDPLEKEGGSGESFVELLARTHEINARLQAHTADFIAVFSHGLFCRALIWSWLTGNFAATPETMRRYHHFVRGVWMPNGAIVKTMFGEDGRVVFSGFDTSHMPLSKDGD